MLEKIMLPSEIEPLLIAEDRKSPIWLVGGVIRDHLTGRETDDFDFVTSGDAIGLARKVADHLAADIYILDQERGAARVLQGGGAGQRITYDFSRSRGETIEADLRARDFSINALALRVSAPDALIDPCGGLGHLRSGRLELCSANAIDQDPIRALRAIRIATDLGFALSPEVIRSLRSKPSIALISRERVRDELFKVLELSEPAGALRLIWEFELVGPIFNYADNQSNDEAVPLLSVGSAEKAIRSVKYLRTIFDLLSPAVDVEQAAEATLGLLTWTLGRYRIKLEHYLQHEIVFERKRVGLILLVTFIHQLLAQSEQGAQSGQLEGLTPSRRAAICRETAESLRLSREELVFTSQCFAALEQLLAGADQTIEVDLFNHRFFREYVDGGVAAALAMLAVELARQVGPPSMDHWATLVERVRSLLEAWFEQPERIVHPELLINGARVMQMLELAPGPEVGDLLRRVLEAQVLGEVATIAEAEAWIKRYYADSEARPQD